jgi:hypothetical protein
MSNHLHLVLRTRPDIVATWSDREVVRRWRTITKLTRSFEDVLVEPSEAQVQADLSDPEYVASVRLRLSSISFFMAALCEYVGRRANFEDGTSGTFWDDRFRARKCTDDAAVLVCGIYIDLNQIRAGEVDRPEEATHSSAWDRIRSWQQRQLVGDAVDEANEPLPDSWLSPLTLDSRPEHVPIPGQGSAVPWRASDKGFLSMSLDDYLSLLDWTGRQLRADKPGTIPSHLAPILERLEIRPDHWLELVTNMDRWFATAIGRLASLLQAAAATGRRWIRGIGAARQVFA